MSLPDERHARLSKLFLEACSLAPERRGAFLEAACDGDPALRDEVQALLASRECLPDYLRTGGLGAPLVVDAAEPAPARLGDFHVLDKLGEGGMGVVYRAEQREGIRRVVAIKLIKRGLETERVLGRFASERQSLALMNHPNIAHVLAAGATADGRPFFTMEYVAGDPITTYCDEHGLEVRQRLELFVRVCDGMQHAHHKAIIHRDIKPSNVLVTVVDGQPTPKIIDFGVAKAIARPLDEPSASTEAGQFVGTPEYMSPEQAGSGGGAVDTRTDVYSLGVLLYELLCCAPAFDRQELRRVGLEEIRRRIRELDPPPPSARAGAPELARMLRGELDWITMRAMEKDPERRYASPSELAADVRRYLADEPVLARPAGHLYLLRKFARKHRVAVGLAAVSVFLLVGVATTTTLQARRTAAARDRAAAAARQAMAKAAAARQVSDFLVNIFDLSPDRQLARQQIGAALAMVQRDYPDRTERARLLYPLGQIYARMGFEEGVPLMLEALEILRETLGAEDPEVLDAEHERARQLAQRGNLDESLGIMQGVLQTRRRVLGEDHRDTLVAMSHWAGLHVLAGRLDEAEPLLLETIERTSRTLGADDRVTLVTRGYLARVRMMQNRLDEAERENRSLLESLSRVLGPHHPNTYGVMMQLAALRSRQGDRQEAIALLRRAIDRGLNYGAAHSRVTLLNNAGLAYLRGMPEFEELVSEDGYLAALDRARDRAWAREPDEALQQLRLAVERGFRSGEALLLDERLTPLHGNPEFQAIVDGLSSSANPDR
jgi:tetratricopeptide (TPR) repeat protein